MSSWLARARLPCSITRRDRVRRHEEPPGSEPVSRRPRRPGIREEPLREQLELSPGAGGALQCPEARDRAVPADYRGAAVLLFPGHLSELYISTSSDLHHPFE